MNLEDKNIDRYNFKVTEDAYYRTFEFDGKMLTFMKSPAVDNPNTKLYWGLVD